MYYTFNLRILNFTDKSNAPIDGEIKKIRFLLTTHSDTSDSYL